MPFSIQSTYRRLITLFKWLPQAKTIDSVDSPYLVLFINSVISDNRVSLRWADIESRRTQLLLDNTPLQEDPYGRNSSASGKLRTIKSITKTAVSKASKCQLLARMVSHYQPSSVLEVGTCLGISTYYIASTMDSGCITTIEGDTLLHKYAQTYRSSSEVDIDFRQGEFKIVLEDLIQADKKYDLIYVDGAHNSVVQQELWPLYEALSHNHTVYVIDDIYWSKDMTSFWESKKEDKEFNIAMDLYYFGILDRSSKIKEPIDVKIFPRRGRWQLGIKR